jgi:cytochrome b5
VGLSSSISGGAKVYDITSWLDQHPGGADILMDVVGKDADTIFEDIGHSSDARQILKAYYIGDLVVGDPPPLRATSPGAAYEVRWVQ